MNFFNKNIKSVLANFSTDNLIVACSGGVDSMVLLHCLLQLNQKVKVAHVNYQLRGEDSELDAQLIKDFCLKHAIEFHEKTINLGVYLEKNGGNLQQEARKIRYNFFQELLSSPNDKIVLAHHLDDQIEHFFLNLGRGANINGLGGMKILDGYLFRPLLETSRQEILKYAKENNVEWREDVSNSKNDYARNKLRNVFIPEMLQYNENLVSDIVLVMETFRATQEEISTKVASIVSHIECFNELRFSDFDELTEDERIELLRKLKLKGIFAKELAKLRTAENGKFLFVAKQHLKIVRAKDCFKFVS
ncbi:MAG: tRNA lysidine(34) synthetase TilS [Bacteroidota bacterium]